MRAPSVHDCLVKQWKSVNVNIVQSNTYDTLMFSKLFVILIFIYKFLFVMHLNIYQLHKKKNVFRRVKMVNKSRQIGSKLVLLDKSETSKIKA
jgi:hypothetical protein